MTLAAARVVPAAIELACVGCTVGTMSNRRAAEMVREFHRVFGLAIANAPRPVGADLALIRQRLLS
jgi:hypothetical protein